MSVLKMQEMHFSLIYNYNLFYLGLILPGLYVAFELWHLKFTKMQIPDKTLQYTLFFLLNACISKKDF